MRTLLVIIAAFGIGWMFVDIVLPDKVNNRPVKTVTLYGQNNEIIGQWKTTENLEGSANSKWFRDVNGKFVEIAGTIVSE